MYSCYSLWVEGSEGNERARPLSPDDCGTSSRKHYYYYRKQPPLLSYFSLIDLPQTEMLATNQHEWFTGPATRFLQLIWLHISLLTSLFYQPFCPQVLKLLLFHVVRGYNPNFTWCIPSCVFIFPFVVWSGGGHAMMLFGCVFRKKQEHRPRPKVGHVRNHFWFISNMGIHVPKQVTPGNTPFLCLKHNDAGPKSDPLVFRLSFSISITSSISQPRIYTDS